MNEKPNFFSNLKKFNFINETKIYNEIQNNKKILIIDLRKDSDFKKMYMPFSLNLPYDQNSEKFYENFINNINPDLSQDDIIKEMLYRFKRYYIAIIFSEEKFQRKEIINYDIQKIKTFDNLYKALCLYQSLISNKVREIGICLKGFKRIYEKYSFMIMYNMNHNMSLK